MSHVLFPLPSEPQLTQKAKFSAGEVILWTQGVGPQLPGSENLFGIVYQYNPRCSVKIDLRLPVSNRVITGLGCYETPTNLSYGTIPRGTPCLILEPLVPCYRIPTGETRGWYFGNQVRLLNLQTQEEYLCSPKLLESLQKDGVVVTIISNQEP